jgi:hypothetical protein
MKNNKGFAVMGILVVIFAILVIFCVAYYTGKDSKELTNIEQNQKLETENKIKVASENNTDEVFNYQPGAIKSIKVIGNNKWNLEVDLLSFNPDFLPGASGRDGEFFINQNIKIRNLNVTVNTKTYDCGAGHDNNDTTPDVVEGVSSFIANIQNMISEGEATAYFDIQGTEITAIYEQCLP